ncbi:sugar-transfer associated ATP-grasp domain-containing protein [Bowmanella dokdonensis]|uniref:Alpha-L-glutamate ligase-related protein ATP-grasp domain-containing protein n=1 Tax=Bowmanella dokdonensis TaxID=751969 RepID=A0A939DT36_9ALTE|nr:sugar-transfer associated ATP-grasp domain-containing protein [Bowmanella dokdonensis]MBN7827436.1 hypothetical protein [Bowmanella dokdonensis]
MIAKLREYLQIAQYCARVKQGLTLLQLLKISWCRLKWGFGPVDYVLFGFADKPLSAPGSYLKKHELEILQKALNQEAFRPLVADKMNYHRICQQQGLAAPEVLAVVQNSSLSDPQPFEQIKDAQGLLVRLQSWGEGQYIFKPAGGSHGEDIFCFRFAGQGLQDIHGKELDPTGLMQKLQLGRFVLQRYAAPHPALNDVMPGPGLGTLRLVTVNREGQVELVIGCAKLPVGGNLIDNFNAGKSLNLVSAINLDSGRLISTYGPDPLNEGNIRLFTQHPQTQTKLSGYLLPNWQEIVSLVKRGAEVFNQLPTIGWDVALTTEGPLLIEANSLFDCDILQVAHNRGLKPDFSQWLQSQQARPGPLTGAEGTLS